MLRFFSCMLHSCSIKRTRRIRRERLREAKVCPFSETLKEVTGMEEVRRNDHTREEQSKRVNSWLEEHKDERCLERETQCTQEKENLAQAQRNRERRYKNGSRVSTWTKLLVRDAIVLLVALAFPFLEGVRKMGDGSEILVPILTLFLALTPPENTCVGQETATFLNIVLTWPLFVAWTLFMVIVSPHSIAGFMVLFTAINFASIWASFLLPNYQLPIVLDVLVFSYMVPIVYEINNFAEERNPFSSTLQYLGAVTFSYFMCPALHLLGALLIFPWFSMRKTRQELANALMVKASLLASLRQAYDKVGRFTMFPREQTNYLFLSEEEVQELERYTAQSRDAVLTTHETLIPTLFETRWTFSGSGYKLVKMHKLISNLSRHARTVSEDLLSKYTMMTELYTSNQFWAERILEREKELYDSTMENCEDGQAESCLRQEILDLVHMLFVTLEVCCKPLALVIQGSLNMQEREEKLVFLKAKQQALEASSSNLEEKALEWSKEFIRLHLGQLSSILSRENLDDPFHRTKLITCILTLRNYVQAQRHLVDFVEEVSAAETPKDSKSNAPRTDARQVLEEWKTTFTFHLELLEQPKVREYEKTSCPSTFLENVYHAGSSVPFRMAVKFSAGTTFLSVFACLPQTREVYNNIGLINAMFTFQVILYKLQTGLVVERTLHRLGGILGAYLYAGAAWELACLPRCIVLDGWALYLLEVPALLLYLWILRTHMTQAYAGFAFVRTYSSLVFSFLAQNSTDQISPATYWEKGGFVVASSFIGGAVALLLGLGIWPTSGRSSLRALLARLYNDFLYFTEEVIFFRYNDLCRCNKSQETGHLERAETTFAKLLFIDAAPLLRAARLETMQKVNFDADYESYLGAVESTKTVWRALWSFHHIGGIRLLLGGSCTHRQAGVSPAVTRTILAMNRILGVTFSIIAAVLAGNRFSPLPILRPMLATPALIKEATDDFMLLCYSDERFMNLVLESTDLRFVVNLIVFRDNLLVLGRALAVVFDFLENFVHRKRIYWGLRGEDSAMLAQSQ